MSRTSERQINLHERRVFYLREESFGDSYLISSFWWNPCFRYYNSIKWNLSIKTWFTGNSKHQLLPDSSIISIFLHLETVSGTCQLKTTTCAVCTGKPRPQQGSLTYKFNPVRISIRKASQLSGLQEGCTICPQWQRPVYITDPIVGINILLGLHQFATTNSNRGV